MEAVRQSSPCFAYVNFLSLCAGYVIDYIRGDAFKIRLDAKILTVFGNKGAIFASCAFTCEGSWLVVKLKCPAN